MIPAKYFDSILPNDVDFPPGGGCSEGLDLLQQMGANNWGLQGSQRVPT